MELPEVADNSPRVASEKQHGTGSENTCNFPIFDTFGRCVWKAIAPRSKHSGTPKLVLEVRRIRTIDGSPHPLPVIYTYGASASDYTCRPNIDYLLYACCKHVEVPSPVQTASEARLSGPRYCRTNIVAGRDRRAQDCIVPLRIGAMQADYSEDRVRRHHPGR